MGGDFSRIPTQILREGNTLFLGVVTLGLLVAMSPPYWKVLPAIGGKGANMQKGRDKRQMQRESCGGSEFSPQLWSL